MRNEKVVRVALVFSLMLAGGSAVAATWNVVDGYFDVPENWNPNGVPANETAANFNASGTVRIPVVGSGGPYRTSACVRSNLPTGSSFTFDAMGASWLIGDVEHWTVNDQQAFILNVDSKRLFGLAGVDRVEDGVTYPLCMMSNAVLRIDATGTAPKLDFVSGDFDFRKPLGEDVYSGMSVQMLDAVPAGSKVVLEDGSTFRASTVQIRCGAAGSSFLVAGGSHFIHTLQVGATKNAAVESLVEMTGGTNFISGTLAVASAENAAGRFAMSGGRVEAAAMVVSNAKTAPATVELSGDARVVVTNFSTANVGGTATMSLSGDAKMTVGADGTTTAFFNNGSGETTLTLDDRAVFEAQAQLSLNKAGNAVSHIAAKGNSRLVTRANLILAGAANGHTDVVLSENATLEAEGAVYVTNNDTSESKLTVKDNASIVLASSGLYVGWTKQQQAVFEMLGGRVAGTNAEFSVRGGKASTATISGGTVDAKYFNVMGANNAADDVANMTNRLIISGGRHRAHYVETTVEQTGLTVGSNAKACVCEISGGELTVPQRVRLQAKSGGLALLRVSGGTLAVETSANESLVSLGHTANVFGRLELTGGEIVADKIVSTSGNGASLLADGGCLTLNQASESVSCLQNVDTVQLGTNGLTVCVGAGKAGALSHALADAAGVDGLFVKAGEGSLLVGTASAHAKTRIDAGTLKTGAATFGKEVSVVGGTLSMEGAPTAFAAERAVFGDGTKTGTLRLDIGDVLTADEIVVNGLVVDLPGVETNKTYSFLSTQTASIDTSKITFADASPLNDYRFTLEPDGVGGYALKLSVEPKPTTEHVWTGAESSDWQTAGNWTGGVPGLLGNAVFGATANPSVRIDSSAQAASLSFTSQTDYDFAGEGSLTVHGDVMMSVAATATFAPSVTLTDERTLDVPAGGRLAFDGGLAGEVRSVAKTGSGELSVGGETSASNVWSVTGGRLAFDAPDAFGADASSAKVTVGPATVAYTGEENAALGGGLAANPGVWRFAIANVTNRLTVGGFTLASGGFLKTGVGELVLDLPAGTYQLPGETKDYVSGADPVVLPASGDSPDMTAAAKWNNLSSFTVLEGRLTLKGAGASQTTFRDLAFLFVGSDYAAARANAELVLDAIRVDQGGSGMHLHVGHNGVTGGEFNRPKLIVRNGALLNVNGMYVSYSKNDALAKLSAELTVEGVGSTLVSSYSLTFGQNNAGDAPRVVIRDGGLVQTPRVTLNRNVELTVTANGTLEQTSPSADKGGFGFSAGGHGSGFATVSDGGLLKVAKLYSSNSAGDGKSVMTNDGGTVAFLLSEVSAFAKPSMYTSGYQTLVAGASDAAFSVGAGLRHVIAFPITGSGAVVKRGTGTLVIGRVLDVKSTGLVETDIAALMNAGGVRCEEGMLVVTNGALAGSAPIAVSAGATVDLDGAEVASGVLSGAGTVRRATLLSARLVIDPQATTALTLEGVTLSGRVNVTVDVADDYVFDHTRDYPLVVLSSAGVHPATVDFSQWKVRRASGKRVPTTFAYDPATGLVTARFLNSIGFMLMVR